MNKYEVEALKDARRFEAEAETILQVSGVAAELDAIERGDLSFGDVASRDLGFIDGATVAGLLINIFMWIGQIRRGQIMKDASREEIIQDLSIRVLDNDTLSATAKERLLTKALEAISDHERL